ncbi:hypothetical protein B7463_g6352, partial [Scytalidium lignicola]
MDTENLPSSDTTQGIQQLQHRACVSCARAKVKCIPGKESGKCERCNRLKRVCEPVLGPKRKPLKPNRITKHHVEKLEEKLDDLVTLLKSSKDPGLNAKTLSSSPISTTLPIQVREQRELEQNEVLNPTPPPRATPFYNQNLSYSTNTPHSTTESSEIHVSIPCSMPCSMSCSMSCSTTSNKVQPAISKPFNIDDGGDELLNLFRDHMYAFFPFVVIPQTMTAKELYEQRPYLYHAILAITTREPALQRARGKDIMRELAERYVVNGERTLDLLLGVLTYAGWCYYHFYAVVNLTSLLSAAQTIIYDLGLHRPPIKEFPAGMVKAAIRKTSAYQSILNPERTLEERRALLGCFFLISVTSVFFHRIEPMQISPYIEECCTILVEAQEYTMDQTAVSLARLQIIVERVRQSPWYSSHDSTSSTIPPMFYIRSVEKQLEELRKSWPRELAQNRVLLMKFYNLQGYVYEIGLSQAPSLATLPSHDFQRLELLHNCLQAVKNYFDIYFSMAFSNFHWFSIPVYTQVTNAIITLERLSNFQHPDWDLAYVRETLDFFGVLDKLIEVFDFGRKQFGMDDSSLFQHSWKKAQAVKAYCESRMVEVSRSSADRRLEPTGELDPDLTMGGSTFDSLNESWLRDAWGQLDYPVDFGDLMNYY